MKTELDKVDALHGELFKIVQKLPSEVTISGDMTREEFFVAVRKARKNTYTKASKLDQFLRKHKQRLREDDGAITGARETRK